MFNAKKGGLILKEEAKKESKHLKKNVKIVCTTDGPVENSNEAN